MEETPSSANPVPTLPAPTLGLTLVTLGVADLERAIAFYTGLGLPRRAWDSKGVAFFAAGGVILSLFPRADLAADSGVADTPPTAFAGISLACNLYSEADVDTLLARAAALGARIVKPAQKTFWGGYAGYFADLDAHIWEVAFNPFVAFDDRGCLVMEA